MMPAMASNDLKEFFSLLRKAAEAFRRSLEGCHAELRAAHERKHAYLRQLWEEGEQFGKYGWQRGRGRRDGWWHDHHHRQERSVEWTGGERTRADRGWARGGRGRHERGHHERGYGERGYGWGADFCSNWGSGCYGRRMFAHYVRHFSSGRGDGGSRRFGRGYHHNWLSRRVWNFDLLWRNNAQLLRPKLQPLGFAYRAWFSSALRSTDFENGRLKNSRPGYSVGLKLTHQLLAAKPSKTLEDLWKLNELRKSVIKGSLVLPKWDWHKEFERVAESDSKQPTIVGPAVWSALRQLSNDPTVYEQLDTQLDTDAQCVYAPPPIDRPPPSHNGSFVDFDLNPRLSIPRLDEMSSKTVEDLERDLERHIQEIRTVIGDIKRVASLGELPITVEKDGNTLRIHFPNSDGPKVERLLLDVDVSRGVVVDLEAEQRDCETPEHSASSSASSSDFADIWGSSSEVDSLPDSFEDLLTPGLASGSSLTCESEVLIV